MLAGHLLTLVKRSLLLSKRLRWIGAIESRITRPCNPSVHCSVRALLYARQVVRGPLAELSQMWFVPRSVEHSTLITIAILIALWILHKSLQLSVAYIMLRWMYLAS